MGPLVLYEATNKNKLMLLLPLGDPMIIGVTTCTCCF